MPRESITKDARIEDVVRAYPQAARVFAEHGLPCVGCHAATYESVEQGAAAHNIPLEPLLADLNRAAEEAPDHHEHEGHQDTVPMAQPQIKRVIAVMGGKGGVGKSLVTALLGVALRKRGYEVGILDADITGPSIPKMFGLTERAGGDERTLYPVRTRLGIEVMSINLLLENPEDAVIWRGPIINKVITQFYEQVAWGELDYLLVDLPPGTSDAPLTVLQSLPVDGVVMVSSPQALANMVVRKAVQLVQKLDTPIIGVIENMAYTICPNCGERHEVFGPSTIEQLGFAAEAPVLGQLPVDAAISRLGDAGEIESYDSPAYEALTSQFVETLDELEVLAGSHIHER